MNNLRLAQGVNHARLDERRNQMFAIKVTMTEPDAIEIFKPGMAAQVVLE